MIKMELRERRKKTEGVVEEEHSSACGLHKCMVSHPKRKLDKDISVLEAKKILKRGADCGGISSTGPVLNIALARELGRKIRVLEVLMSDRKIFQRQIEESRGKCDCGGIAEPSENAVIDQGQGQGQGSTPTELDVDVDDRLSTVSAISRSRSRSRSPISIPESRNVSGDPANAKMNSANAQVPSTVDVTEIDQPEVEESALSRICGYSSSSSSASFTSASSHMQPEEVVESALSQISGNSSSSSSASFTSASSHMQPEEVVESASALSQICGNSSSSSSASFKSASSKMQGIGAELSGFRMLSKIPGTIPYEFCQCVPRLNFIELSDDDEVDVEMTDVSSTNPRRQSICSLPRGPLALIDLTQENEDSGYKTGSMESSSGTSTAGISDTTETAPPIYIPWYRQLDLQAEKRDKEKEKEAALLAEKQKKGVPIPASTIVSDGQIPSTSTTDQDRIEEQERQALVEQQDRELAPVSEKQKKDGVPISASAIVSDGQIPSTSTTDQDSMHHSCTHAECRIAEQERRALVEQQDRELALLSEKQKLEGVPELTCQGHSWGHVTLQQVVDITMPEIPEIFERMAQFFPPPPERTTPWSDAEASELARQFAELLEDRDTLEEMGRNACLCPFNLPCDRCNGNGNGNGNPSE